MLAARAARLVTAGALVLSGTDAFTVTTAPHTPPTRTASTTTSAVGSSPYADNDEEVTRFRHASGADKAARKARQLERQAKDDGVLRTKNE